MLDDVERMTSQLVIDMAQDDDSGEYQCMAVNGVGKIYSQTATITVHSQWTYTSKFACTWTSTSGCRCTCTCHCASTSI